MDTIEQGVTKTIMDSTNESVVQGREILVKPTALVAIEAFTLLIIMLVAIAANITAITIILRVRSLRQNPHNLLILNLSVADLGVALTSMTFSLASVFDGGYFLLEYHKVCLGHAFFAMIFSYVNFPTIVCIAIDRVLIVTNKSPLSYARAYGMIACCWVIALTNVMFPTNNLFMSAFAYLPDTLHCSPLWPNRVFRIIYAIINYGAVIIILTTCYIIITYYLRKKGKQLRCHQKSVPIKTLNTSVSSYQSTVSTETKGTAQLTTLSYSGIQHPSSGTTSSDSIEPKPSSTGEPPTSWDQRPELSKLSSWIHKPSEIQLYREPKYPTLAAQSSSIKTSESSSTGETPVSVDQGLESSAIPKASGIQLAPEPAVTLKVTPSLSPSKTVHSSQKEQWLSEEKAKDGEEAKKEDNEEEDKTGQLNKEEKHSPSKPASLLGTVNAAVPTQSGSTKNQGDNNHFEKDLCSTSETRTSQGYDSDKEVKGRGKRNVRADKSKFKAEKRVALMGALLVLTTMISWTPYVLFHSRYLGLPEGHWFGVFTMWLGYCNALLDPLIYSFMNFRVRKEIKRFFRSASVVCNPMKLFSR